MSPDPLVPDFVPDELVAKYGSPSDRRPRRPGAPRPAGGHLRAAPPPELTAVAPAPHPSHRRAQRRQAVAIVVAVELGLLGMVGAVLWWTALASSNGSWTWTVLTYVGWLLVLHLPTVMAIVIHHMTDDRSR